MSRWGDHLTTRILPWWEGRAVDADRGGVFTCFDNAGSLLSHDKYSWSQGRWAWLAAELATECASGGIVGDAEAWANRAESTARFLDRHVILEDHRTIFRTDADGVGLPDAEGRLSTSVFADLFVALGLSAAGRIATDRELGSQWQARATAILLAAETAIAERTALSEPYPVPDGFTALAWPMNLLHTAAELLRARPDDDAVRGVRDRAWSALLGPDGMLADDTWWEFRPDGTQLDDTLLADTVLARHRTPGHLLELLWMLDHAARPRTADDADHTPPPPSVLEPDRMVRLATRAFDLGWDHEHGGLLRYVDHRGGPPAGPAAGSPPERYETLVRTTGDTKLWWVHSEAMYTLALLADHDQGLRERLDRLVSYTLDTFPDPDHGEWIQIRRRDGTPLDEVVALPVKDPFHVARSLLLLHRHDRPDTPSKGSP